LTTNLVTLTPSGDFDYLGHLFRSMNICSAFKEEYRAYRLVCGARRKYSRVQEGGEKKGERIIPAVPSVTMFHRAYGISKGVY
jgi:hypothetical protein